MGRANDGKINRHPCAINPPDNRPSAHDNADNPIPATLPTTVLVVILIVMVESVKNGIGAESVKMVADGGWSGNGGNGDFGCGGRF